jgi:hypothetical protein
MAKVKPPPYLCCNATWCCDTEKGKDMNALRNSEALTSRLGLIFSAALVAILPLAAILAVIEAL